MGQKDNFEKKDWGKEAKAFARQAYGKKKKMESLKQERRIAELEKTEDWDD